ncbi:unnamed protein product [Lupinus luteus]|uniref:Solute carrier family 40 member n=1 Tax=Lupinus luteus TaxID=3873 RepID=A0AAV1VTA9_LUPLU
MAITATDNFSFIHFRQFSQPSLSSSPSYRIRHRFPYSRLLNKLNYSCASHRFSCLSSRCSITNTDIHLDHITTDDTEGASSAVEPECLVPIVKLNSDILETVSSNVLNEATFVDTLLTALPILTAEEQHALAATPAHPAGLHAFYASCIAANMVEQLWNFAWPSAIALIHPSLLPVAVIVSTLLLRPWFAILVSAGSVERLCGVALGVANERDWVVLLAGVNRPVALAQANAFLNRIDLLSEIVGASLFGVLLSKFHPVICLKVAAGLIMGLLPVTILFIRLANMLSTGVLDRSMLSQTCCTTFSEDSAPDADSIVVKGMEAIMLGWKEYLGQPVLHASLAWVLLCFNVVLTPGSLMTTFLTQRGLSPSIIGGFNGMCAFMGVAATFVSSTLVKQFGILKAGAIGLVFQALLLSMAVAVYWSGSISRQSPLLVFLSMIILSRLGHMSYDIVGAQIIQTGIPSSKANLIGTTEVAVASLAECIMLGVAIIANDPSHFGGLAMLSLISVVVAAWMFCRWLLNPTDEQKVLFSYDPRF